MARLTALAQGKGPLRLPAKVLQELLSRWRTFGVASMGRGCLIETRPLVNARHITIGRHTIIRRHTELLALPGKPISIGDECSINQGVLMRPDITIGNRVSIGARSMLQTDSHELGTTGRRAGPHQYGPITIGDGAWLGLGTIVLPGVTIGEGAVIGAGSVVTRDVEPNAVYVGAPAKLLRRLEPLRPPERRDG